MKCIKILFFLLISTICFSSCYDLRPNGDGTMTVVEYNLFKTDSTVLYNVKCPKYYQGCLYNYKKGKHFVGLAGKGGHYVTHYDIKVIYENGKIVTDRIYKSTFNDIIEGRRKIIVKEIFYPEHNTYITYEN